MTATIICATLIRRTYPYSLWIGGHFVNDYRTIKLAQRRAKQLGATTIKYIGH